MKKKIFKYHQLEQMINNIKQEQIELSNQLSSLRSKGESKSYQFRELMTKKLNNLVVLNTLEKYKII